jgi:hypothetical protein
MGLSAKAKRFPLKGTCLAIYGHIRERPAGDTAVSSSAGSMGLWQWGQRMGRVGMGVLRIL